MTIFGVTIAGSLFFAGTVALFGWGVWLGIRGILADFPAYGRGGYGTAAAVRTRKAA